MTEFVDFDFYQKTHEYFVIFLKIYLAIVIAAEIITTRPEVFCKKTC